MGKINLNIIWMCECNPVVCLFSSGLFTSPVYVWVLEFSHAAHSHGDTATWLVCLWASFASSRMRTKPSRSTAPLAVSYCNQSAAWILYTRAFWRKGQMESLGRGTEENAVGPRSRRRLYCADSPVCSLLAPPASPWLWSGQSHAPQTGTGTHQCQTSLLSETAGHKVSE